MHCDMGQRCIIVGCRISFLLEHGIRTPRVLFAIQAQSRLICGHVLRSEYYARADKVAVFLSMVRRVYCSSAALKGVYHTPDVSSVRVCVCVCVCTIYTCICHIAIYVYYTVSILDACMCMCVHVCMYVYVCVCMCMHVYACVYACVCMSLVRWRLPAMFMLCVTISVVALCP